MYPKILGSYVDDKIIWFIPYGQNAVFTYDIETKMIAFVFAFRINEKANEYRTIVKLENKLILAPYVHDEFLVFDLKTNQYHMITVEYKDKLRLTDAVCHGEFIYFISQDPAVVRYHINNEKVDVFGGLDVEEHYTKKTVYDVWSRGKGCVIQQDVLIPHAHNSTITIWHLEENVYDSVKFDQIQSGINNIICIGNKLWILPREGNKLYCKDRQDGEMSFIDIGTEINGYCHMYQVGEFLVIINSANGLVYKIDILNNRIEKISGIYKESADNNLIRWMSVVDNRLYFSLIDVNGMVSLDIQDGAVQIFSMNMSNRKEYDTFLSQCQIIKEEPYISLDFFLNNINSIEKKILESKVGKDIYYILKEEIYKSV